MRADRLISLLLLLQQRGRTTAAEAARELEVSERTARRDLEALAMSGVPVYSTAGRGGGWQLLGGATTDLTGLSADEARALFLAAGPMLEHTPELQSAMRKLTSALPETFRADAETASAAIKIDPSGWGQISHSSPPPNLALLTDAVVSGHQVRIDYASPRTGPTRRIVHPLGLVTKRGVWYLVTDTERGIRTFRVSRILTAELLDEPVVRPADFDLDDAWAAIVTEVEAKRTGVVVDAIAGSDVLTPLRWQFGDRLTEVQPRSDGRTEIRLEELHAVALAAQLAGYGNRVELVDPPADVESELARIAAELSDMYAR